MRQGNLLRTCTRASLLSIFYRPQVQWSPLKLYSTMTAPSIPATSDAQNAMNLNGKRPNTQKNNGKARRLKKRKAKPIQEGSAEDVLLTDIRALLASHHISEPEEDVLVEEAKPSSLPEPGSEIEVDAVELSSTGDALAMQRGSSRIYVVPFSVPGDTVKVKVYRHLEDEDYSVADFISVTKPSPLRDDSRIRCQYFGRCSGCQFQMLDYDEQLKIKKRIVEKAYKNFSRLPPELVPPVQDTIGSPLQYGYRTKLTPHFEGPPGFNRRGPKKTLEKMPAVGFTPKGMKRVLDIEDCPIGTDAVRKGLKRERERMAVEYGKYERGATILLRENTIRVPKTSPDQEVSRPDGVPDDAVRVETDSYVDFKTCVTDNNATTTEYVDDFIFTNPAGAFFQNNNSILPSFTDYIRRHVLPPTNSGEPIRYLIDAYSGSGLFTITLSSLFPGGSAGIDIADKSIAFARRNATLNGLAEAQCRFLAADAPQLFRGAADAYDPNRTVVVIDPPRKGCDDDFLHQLLRFAPRRIVYVSCNVHTQARDVGTLVRGEVGPGVATEADLGSAQLQKDRKKVRYAIESLRGFDFFPQTGHVEGVAVLNRIDT
ncbi:hypothetical protein VTK73DRAFT_6383 [Phialemonium thermophilum]|uniref:TRAM domain-containing protein n=1 Tax=Phialemonium thermophilum TaxID=223376 RepID=A0ABR3XVG7_9PEZI